MTERDDWDAPDIEEPVRRLTDGEMRVIFAEACLGASVYALARYFNTTASIVNAVVEYGETHGWMIEIQKPPLY